MQISRNSWHFRLLGFFGGAPGYWRDTADLCRYMRKLVIALSLVVFAALMIGLYPYACYLYLHYGPGHLPHGLIYVLAAVSFQLVSMVLAAVALVGGTFLFVVGWTRLKDKINSGEPAEPGMVRTW